MKAEMHLGANDSFELADESIPFNSNGGAISKFDSFGGSNARSESRRGGREN